MKLINIITNKIELNNNYIHDKHLVSRCFYHVIFCTKYRRKAINDEVAERMKSLLEESQQKYNFQLIEYEIMPEHVHLLILCSAKNHIHTIVSNIKGFLSRTLREEFPFLKSRLPSLWSRGKFIATVGSVSLETVQKYISEQKKQKRN